MEVSMFLVAAVLPQLLLSAAAFPHPPAPPLTSAPSPVGFISCLYSRFNSTNAYSEVLFTPKDPAFATTLYAYNKNSRHNRTTTPKPVAIVAAKLYSEVQAAVICAKRSGIQLRIRSGGHDYEGMSYVSNVPFAILDFFNLRRIDVDVKNEVAWVQSGAILGELYYKVANESNNTLAFPAGVCLGIGAGGHFSAGGYGTLLRKYGLSSDNVLDAEVMDANGEILTGATLGEDLFWAIRGGGAASFGVVLSWKLRLVRVPQTVTVFSVKRTLEEGAVDVIDQWQRFAPAADPNLFIRAQPQLTNATEGNRNKTTVRVSFNALFLGRAKELVALLKEGFPLLDLKLKDTFEVTWLQSAGSYYIGRTNGSAADVFLDRSPLPPNSFHKQKSDYVQEPIPKEGWAKIFNKMIELGLPGLFMQFNPYGGRMSDIADDATPFPHRVGNLFKIQYLAAWEDPSIDEEKKQLKAINELYDTFTPYVSKNPRSAFLCYRDIDIGTNADPQLGFARDIFKGNVPRLLRTKAKVDPDNFFRYEQSIPVKAY